MNSWDPQRQYNYLKDTPGGLIRNDAPAGKQTGEACSGSVGAKLITKSASAIRGYLLILPFARIKQIIAKTLHNGSKTMRLNFKGSNYGKQRDFAAGLT